MTEETLFAEVLAKPPVERAAFLDGECAGRPELRAAGEARLAAHEKSGNILDQPPAKQSDTVDSELGKSDHIDMGEHTPQADHAPVRSAATTDFRPNVEPGTVIAGRYTLVG